MINGLIATTFAARNVAHIEHWNTKSYAEHVALDDFYEGIIDLVDNFVECYQGLFGLVGEVKLTPSDDKLINILAEDIEWFQENREELCKGSCVLENLLDGITELYMKTKYKLENLS